MKRVGANRSILERCDVNKPYKNQTMSDIWFEIWTKFFI